MSDSDKTTLSQTCHAMLDYHPSNSDPLTVEANEPVSISKRVFHWHNNPQWVWVWCTDQRGKSGWTPLTYLIYNEDGDSGTIRHPYTAAELTISTGDELTIEYEESGWYWCTNIHGEKGWVPVDYVQLNQ